MKESTSTALMFGAALFLALALIGIAVNVFSPATDAAKTATSDFSAATTELKDQKYLIYDNTTISGSQVINALRKFEAEGKAQSIGIEIVTNKGVNQYYNTVSSTGDIIGTTKNPTNVSINTSDEYVNPSGNFKASIIRDVNQVIRGIKFIQQ